MNKAVFKVKFQTLLTKLLNGLHHGLDETWEFLYPFVKLFMTQMGQEVAAAAMVAVTECAATMGGADGQEKRKAAYDKMVAILATKGVVVGASVIYAAIEAAVQKLNSDEEEGGA